MREIRILPGQKFDRSLLVRTIRELSQVGYFNPETIEPNLQPNFEDATVDITFQLEERPMTKSSYQVVGEVSMDLWELLDWYLITFP
ncbi:POTRA domain-containing protein [Echinicola jeungdonensis]|uniref:POTRA domain-containing protein n=1 Tax=Echinicola jeungdonensis TaxID=709343 RepID=UPI0025B5F7AC|nr:POTRA domain-containing protein [Echinicola jeungdonensis]MDN3671275.1 POTRA domain-containing protein [Echinicola jeungdonensis]